jgi:diguanylate cyclase (GGDEF)-like protein
MRTHVHLTLGSSPRKERWVRLSWMLLLVVCGLALTRHVVELERSALQERLQTEASVELGLLRAQLQGEMNGMLHMARSAATFASLHPELSEATWRDLVDALRHEHPLVSHLVYAPDMVIRWVHPMPGHEAVVGLDYRDLPYQWPAVARMLSQRDLVLAGPLPLVQGGEGIVARTPVLGPAGGLDPASRLVTGLVALVIHSEALFAQTGVTRLLPDRVALQGADGLCGEGAVILGDRALFDDPGRGALVDRVELVGGCWLLAVTPAPLSRDQHLTLKQTWTVGLSLTMLLAVLLWLLMTTRHALRRMASEDELTGLANRRQAQATMDRLLRRPTPCTVMLLDLNGFKEVNDTLGHLQGDLLLQQVARCLTRAVLQGGSVARVGGDEFLVLWNRALQEGDIQLQVEQFRHGLQDLRPFADRVDGVRFSVGWALSPRDGTTAAALLTAADRRMYRQKQGRIEASLTPDLARDLASALRPSPPEV